MNTYAIFELQICSNYEKKINNERINHKKSRKVKLPKITTNDLTKSKGANCSYINNHKSYLTMKGYNLNDIYSLKRNRKHNENMDSGLSNSHAFTMKTIRKPKRKFLLPALRNGIVQKNVENVWRPDDSRQLCDKDVLYRNSIEGISKRKMSHYQRKVDYLCGDQLDHVMTTTRLRSLLAREEAFVPKNDFTNFSTRY
jgi:hypothetical protein